VSCWVRGTVGGGVCLRLPKIHGLSFVVVQCSLFIYDFYVLSNMVSFSSQRFLSASNVFYIRYCWNLIHVLLLFLLFHSGHSFDSLCFSLWTDCGCNG